jgi:subtilisin family serine protease
MAPDTELFLYKVGDEVDLMNSVTEAISRGVRVINHSVGWVNASFYDGTGPISDIATAARASDILWVNAAGNNAQAHWSGNWSDPDADNRLNFANGAEEIELSGSSGTAQIFLNWDAYPATNQDYDLHLVNKNNTVVAASQNWQTGSQEPAEALAYNLLPSQAPYKLRVVRYSGTAPMRFHLHSFQHDLATNVVAASSLMDPAPSSSSLTVGAMSVAVWNSTQSIEVFSSQGPTSSGAIKPDLTGPDGNATVTYPSFYGTSSASPHVAGMAALLRGLHPEHSADQVQAELEAGVVDVGAAGKDNVFGAGKLRKFVVECLSDAECSDGNTCNGGETCNLESGLCTPGTPLECDDGNPCTADSCNLMTGCAHAVIADGAACPDGNVCNGSEICQAGACVAGAAPNCDDGNACTTDSCNPATGCAPTPVADGIGCGGGDACSAAGTCQA